MLAQFRKQYQQIVAPLGKFSVKLGIGPDFWTLFSIVIAAISAFFLSQHMWGWGLILAILANMADAMDGASARAKGVSSAFGSVLDHNVDRYVEYILLLGVMLSGAVPGWLVLTALFGTVMASYVRAKAESIGGLESCDIGIAGRAEKLLILFVGIGLEGWFGVKGSIYWSLVIIAVVSHYTFLQRLLYTRSKLLDSRITTSEEE
ncbi:MAG: CDP-alcohol phosphatidyltransferase family protein [Chloroflexota bacterium]